MKRRDFLQKVAATGIVLPISLGFPSVRAFAKSPAGSPFQRIMSVNKDRIFILIRLSGGNDGLNTVVPYTNADYYSARSGGAEAISIAANKVVQLPDSSTMGLHPSFQPTSGGLLDLYKEKKMVIVQNVAYPNQNLSHFRSTDIWLSASDYNVYDNSGWYAKFLEKQYPDYPSILPADPFAIELGTYLSTTLVGKNNNMGVAVTDLSYIPNKPDDDPVAQNHEGDEEQYVKTILKQSNVFSNSIIAAGIKQQTNKVTYPTNNALATGLAAIARVIAGGLITQMYIVNVSGYDTHTDQLVTQANLHDQFAKAVFAFQRDLEGFGLDQKVCFMTISEFGRRPQSNGSGTDHGSAAPLFVFGAGVKGGIIGTDPDLKNLDSNKNLAMKYDFRQVYASVLGQWFEAAETDITSVALPRHFEQLPIFKVSASGISDNSDLEQTVFLGQNYPNPASDATIIPIAGILSGTDAKISVLTLDGREISSQEVMPGQKSVEINTKSLPNGSYFYVLTAGSVRRMQKMIVAR